MHSVHEEVTRQKEALYVVPQSDFDEADTKNWRFIICLRASGVNTTVAAINI